MFERLKILQNGPDEETRETLKSKRLRMTLASRTITKFDSFLLFRKISAGVIPLKPEP